MNKPKTNIIQKRSRPVHTQIMRRIAPVIVVAFAVFAVLLIAIYWNSLQAQLNEAHESELEERAAEIAEPIESAIANVETLVRSPVVNTFANEAINISRLGQVGLPASQSDLLQLMLGLLNQNQGLYLGARFISADGSVWLEVANQNGVISTNLQLQPARLANDNYFTNINLQANNGLTVTPIIISEPNLTLANDTVPPVAFRVFKVVPDPRDASVVNGVIEIDISATPMLGVVNNSLGREGQRWLLVNNQNRFLADSTSTVAIASRGLTENFYNSVSDKEPDLAALIQGGSDLQLANLDNTLISSRYIQVGGITDMPWQLIIVDSNDYGIGQFYVSAVALIAISTLGCVLTIAFISRILRRRLEPLTVANDLALKLAQGGIDDTLPPGFRAQDDEVGQLIASFDHLSMRLRGMSSDLQDQLEAQARGLDMITRITRQQTNMTDLNQRITQMVDLIAVEFSLYHAQVFLLDDIGLQAVLVYSRGAVGQQLLESGLKVQVGSETMVGQAAAGKVAVVNDARGAAGTLYKANPALPDTRSQLALPLLVGEDVIGVLDMYSNRLNAFHPNETRLFSLLADELAAAVHHVRLLTASEQRVQQVDTLNRQLTRNAWQDFQKNAGLEEAYRYNLVDIQPAQETDESVIEAISAPITIRGEVIGTIAAAAPEGTSFVQGDVAILRAVADRVGLAIEGARLFNETQTSLFVAASLYELSRLLSEVNSLEDVVRAIVTSVMPEASGGQVWLFDEYMSGTLPEWLRAVADWSSTKRSSQVVRSLMNPVRFTDSIFLNGMESDHIKLVADVERDKRLDDDLRVMFQELGAKSAVFVPFSVRGTWRGIISIEFPEVRHFAESEGRIFTALIDQSGVAIENRLLIQQTELTLNQIERMYEASRIINASQNTVELVRAALVATTDTNLNFGLGILEGQLDNQGWPTLIRHVAYSENGEVYEVNALERLTIDRLSPLRRREPEVVVDATAKPPFRAVFPLFSANQPIALVYVTSSTAREMSAKDSEIYHAITGQIGTVLENRRLLEQTEVALDETRRLYTASRAIAAAQDSNAVYQAASEYLSQPVEGLDRISILLGGPKPGLDAAYFDYVYVWERQPDPKASSSTGLRVNADAAPFGNLMAEVGELVYFRDIESQLSEQNRLRIALQRTNANSAIIIPLRTQRNWFGVLICESPSNDAFEEQYRRFAQAVTDQVAIAVENRLLFDEAQLEAQRALALAEVGQLATRVGSEFERNISEVFARVAGPAAYDRWLLMLVSDEDPNILITIAWNSPNSDETSSEMLFDLTSTQHSVVDSVRQDQVVVINDPTRYPAFAGWNSEMVEDIGKHIVIPIHIADEIVGVLMIGRDLTAADLDERDEQLVHVLAAQVAVAVENRRLFHGIEKEREYLRSILNTMPTGIMVLDAHSFKPLEANAQAETLLGKPTNYHEAFSVVEYNLLRTGTNVHYPVDELPIFTVTVTDSASFSDDIAVIHEDGSQTDLLLNAAPIRDARGNITAIVAAFQDISNLRGLENALQNNLRETIALYEATRALSDAGEIEEVLDATIMQLFMLEPSDGYIVLLNDRTGDLTPVRGLMAAEQFNLPAEIFEPNRMLISNVEIYEGLDAETRETLLERNIQALAVVPIRARESLLGWITVSFDQLHDFTPEDERFLTTLTDSAAVSIDNRNLFLRTEVAFQEATTLYETSRVLSNASSPNDIVSAVVNQMRQPHVNHVFMAVPSVVTVDGNIESMHVVASWQQDEDTSISLLDMMLSPDQFPAWEQVASPDILLIGDVENDPRLNDTERLGLLSMDTYSLAVLPLRSGNRRIGVIWMGASTAYTYNERDVRIFGSFIEQASLSLEAARLLEQTERRARQLATSAEVSQIASSILDMNVLMPRIVDLIRDSFNYDHVQIFLMDDQDVFALLKASTGDAGKQLLSIKHKLAKGSASVIGTVTSTGQPAIAQDTADARFVHKPNPYLPLTRSEMALPLIVKNRVVGALDVQSNQPNAFSEEDVAVLTTLANQISVAFDNARLFEQSESRARDMSFLFTVTSAAANAELSLNASLQNVANLVRNAFDALNVSIYLTETYTTEDGTSHSILRAAALSGSSQPLSEVAEVYLGDETNVLASIARTLEPVIIQDTDAEPHYLPITSSARSAVAVPLAAGNKMVGVIAMEDGSPNTFGGETVNLLRALTSTLTAIIQNAQLLEQVQLSNEQLRELDRLKSDFLANMSHELRTPLNSIIGFSRVILKGIDGPLTEMQEQDLSTIYNSGTHLLNLINDILDQAKINSGKMDVHPDYFDMKPVVEGVRSIAIGLVKDKSIDLRLELASGLPKAYGDEFRTRQVLINLVSNAGKFTQQGSITIRVYTEVHPDTAKTMLRVDVHDTGIGIAEKDLPLLFEAFRQVDSSLTRTVGGTGLGLPIAKSLIEMMGGQMLVASEVNVGSTFSILLPLEPSEPAVSPEAGQQPGSSAKAQTGPLNNSNGAPASAQPAPATRGMQTGQLPPLPAGSPDEQKNEKRKSETLETAAVHEKRIVPNFMPSKRQILLIEDNPDMVDQFRRTLQREGFDIFAASIPLEAEAMASGLHPTLIIMDVNFSKGAGWDILKRLQNRDDTLDIPVIVVTLSSETQRITDSGAFAILQRPFTPDQLVEKVVQAEAESQTERILIIDDQPESSRLLKQVLDEQGRYRVFEAHSGMEGVSMIARRRPDLIILDLRMPEMDGFAVLEELQANPETAAIPVMVVTADTLNEAEQGQLAGVDIMYKTDLGQENYRQFINGIRSYLGDNGG